MRKRFILWLLLAVALVSSTAYAAYAFDYFTYRMNFPPGTARTHVQEITFAGNLTITLPNTFSFVSSTASYSVSGSNYTWQSNASATINYTIQSPSSCTEDTIYKSQIYNNGTLIDEFVYVCVYDSKVVDFKVEYGHGCGNYLSENELFISNESVTLFNLVRVWNIGGYLDPDEDAVNANIGCSYERYPVRTYGRVDISYYPNRVDGIFNWDKIIGGYWFRIGVVSQDVSGKSIGDTYDINCTELTYDFEHERVAAHFPDYSVEVRSATPLIMNTTPSGSVNIVTIKNIEDYPIYNLVLDLTINGYIETNYVPKLAPGETLTYYADPGTNTIASFVPSWYRNCFTPVYYRQVLTNASNITINQPPSYSNIPSYAWAENTSYPDAFDLDDYFSDPENDTLTYNYTGNTNINITIDPTSHNVSFSQPGNWTGIEYVVFSADDGNSTTHSNNITLVVYPANATVQNITIIQNVTNITIVGGGGGGGFKEVPVYITIEPEIECREIWLCTNWTACSAEGYKERTCIDVNNCTTESFKPVTLENCTYEEGAAVIGDGMGAGRPEEEMPSEAEVSKEGFLARCKVCSYVPYIILALLIIAILFLIIPEKKHKSSKEVSKWQKPKKAKIQKKAKL